MDKDTDNYNIKELDLDIIQPNNKTMGNRDQGGSKIAIIGKPGCFAPGTRILMYDRTVKNVEDVIVGDQIMGDDFKPRNVEELCHNFDEMFEVISDWKSYTVNIGHTLVVLFEDYSEPAEILVSDFLKLSDEQQKKKFKIFRQYNHSRETSFFYLESKGYGEYFGFVIDKNHRFLLESFDVVRNTGKSTLIADILYNKRDIYPCIMVMSGTEDSNGFYKKIIPTTFIYNKLQTDRIESWIKRQKLALKHLSNPWSILLLDDCTDDPKILHTPLFQNIFKNGRQWKCTFILSLQYCMDIRPVIRNNIDGTFILRETNIRSRKLLWENYAGIIPDFQLFCSILDQVTEEFTALYIHNASKSNNWQDCVFWYKAKPVSEKFRFGCDDFWNHCDSRYNKEYVEFL